MPKPGLTYKDAGVDIERGDLFVERIKDRALKTTIPGVLGGVGGFASLFSLKEAAHGLRTLGTLEDPLLVSGTDGVGTKLKVAFATGRHDTVGQDLVAMCVNDIVTTGAVPLFFLDYFGTGRLDADVAETVVSGIAKACEKAGCALVGGETAELPGLYADGEYDLAGFAVGVVDRKHLIDGQSVRPGDVLLGLPSSGIHSNGLSLARKALLERAGYELTRPFGEGHHTLGDELLIPTRLYPAAVAAARAAGEVKAIAHITGGGLPGNVPRVLPSGTRAELERSAWPRPAIFDLIQEAGQVDDAEMQRTFNLGLGLVMVLAPEQVESTESALSAAGYASHRVGQIVAGPAGAEAEAILV